MQNSILSTADYSNFSQLLLLCWKKSGWRKTIWNWIHV